MGKQYMIALKRGESQPNGLISICESVAPWCSERRPFPDFFTGQTALVPVPSSSLLRDADTIWVPKLLAKAMSKHGLGSSVETCLHRVKPIPKAHMQDPENRPSFDKHFNTMEIRHTLVEHTKILLVDDIVTRGATFLGAAHRVAEAYPNADIRAFAAMRTVSNVNGKRLGLELVPAASRVRWDGAFSMSWGLPLFPMRFYPVCGA